MLKLSLIKNNNKNYMIYVLSAEMGVAPTVFSNRFSGLIFFLLPCGFVLLLITSKCIEVDSLLQT